MKKRPLTPKQRQFVAEYLKDLNGAAAVQRAGYDMKRPDQQAYALLRKPEIAQAIATGKAKQLERADISAARILEELRRVALTDVRSFFDAVGNAKPFSELTEEQGACVAGFEVVKKNATAGDGHTDTVLKFKLWNKNHALETLCKHLGLLQADKEPPAALVPCFVMPEGTQIAIE